MKKGFDMADKSVHGRARKKGGGMTIQTDYGKDKSDVCMGKSERGPTPGGSDTNLGHSLTGTAAVQRATPGEGTVAGKPGKDI